ncbi:MAG: DUF1592 domain-containing protein [Myxococcales bacterium]|nr:DUF1592 domain-containing protein [Myxococcales bacterium]
MASVLQLAPPLRSLSSLRPLAVLLAAGSAACTGLIGDVPDDETAPPPEEALAAQPIHKLNRLEYNNTVRDLLGTSLRPADAFPPDGESLGFDNIAAVLQLTPTLLDAYYGAARATIDEALEQRAAYAFGFGPTDFAPFGGYPVGELWALTGNAFAVTVDVPEDGTATITLLLGGAQIGPAPAPELLFELDGVGVEQFLVPGTAAALQAKTFSVSLPPGAHTLRFVPVNFVNDAVANTSNNVLVASLDVRSDALVDGPGKDIVFVCDPSKSLDAVGCWHTIIETFAMRAYRRPLLETERAGLVSLWQSLRDDGETDEQALRLVMRSIMTAPAFLYRARSTSDNDGEEFLDDYVLASRLSYFLWSSMPDDRLFAAAEAGELGSEEGLAEAARWMLADDKARGLIDGFAEQWLSTRGLELASPSSTVYPTFDEALRASMAEESRLFFDELLSSDRPLASALAPDFAYIDARLAEHYGLDAPEKEGFAKVSATATDRAGLLSLSAWLTVTSDAEHSSPIKRGRWLSDRILCQPVPPPPAGLVIEPLPQTEELTTREKLEMHRSDPTCASCHNLLDVLGMGLETFDGIGRVRTEVDLDTMGQLPDGQTFEGPDALAAAVDPTRFAACTTEKLFTYSLGRGLGQEDRDAVDAIAAKIVNDGASLRDVIVAIVLSPSFRKPGPLDGGAEP